jgi:Mrp family chromosome partitioning ATPase
MLRSQLSARLRETKARVVGVVSAADAEGKTLTAVNLAVSVAADPSRPTLLVDLDVRRPGVAAALGLQLAEGFERSLRVVDGSVIRIWQLAPFPNLQVLPLAVPLREDAAILADERTHALLRQLPQSAGVALALVDLPPVLLSDEALAVASALDGVIVVAAEGETRRDDLAKLRRLLDGVPVLAAVLNRATGSERRVY